mmetsp:Transcript_100815/g.289760  ORF Transcript_100815/g.289760 Transcript_100815/m.289760 type:complete len:303 (-) Transcript_100815:451-1359(-)
MRRRVLQASLQEVTLVVDAVYWRPRLVPVRCTTSLQDPDQHTKRVQIRFKGVRLLVDDLRRSVAEAAHGEAEAPSAVGGRAAQAEPEVGELRAATGVDHDIAWLKVPEEHVQLCMHEFESKEDLGEPKHRLRGCPVWHAQVFRHNASVANVRLQVAAGAELHHHGAEAAVVEAMQAVVLHQTGVWVLEDLLENLPLSLCDIAVRMVRLDVLNGEPCFRLAVARPPHDAELALADDGLPRHGHDHIFVVHWRGNQCARCSAIVDGQQVAANDDRLGRRNIVRPRKSAVQKTLDIVAERGSHAR